MKWVHISDIHFNFKNYNTDVLREKLIQVLEEEKDIDFILITGDSIYQYGKYEKTDDSINFIKDIIHACKCDKTNVYLCPGNHDINRNDMDRNAIIDQIRGNKLSIDNSSANKLVELGHEKFKNIYMEITGKKYSPFEVFEVKKDGKKYRIVSVDTCLLSKDKQDDGNISVQTNKLFELNKKIKADEYLNIAIMHHGIEFFEHKAGKAFQHWLEDHKVDIVFCGHSHQAGVKTYDDTKSEIKQFTSGAALIDEYAIPSFYICNFDEKDWVVEIGLYTFSDDNSNWEIDNHHLRAFDNGINKYYVPRKYIKAFGERKVRKEYNVEQIINIEKDFFSHLNERVYRVYGKEIRSSKLDNIEEFSVQKIFKSLIKIGIPTDKILLLLEEVVNEITLISFYERRQKFISTGDIRTCVYTKICNMPVDNEVSSYDINEWAGKYARRYGHNNKRMKILMPDGKEEVLSYNFVVRELLKDVIIKVTNCDEYYESVLRNELNYMAEEIIQFLKNCNLYYIKYDVLVDFVIEMAMQTPHPWLINDTTREKIIEYNKETLEKHLLKLNGRQEEITVLETLYHATAIILCYYTTVIGNSETSPINNLTYSINKLDTQEKTPIKRNKLLRLENDLVSCSIEWSRFCILINELYTDAIINRDFKGERITKNVINLSDIALSLISFYEIEKEIVQTPMEKIASFFSVKEGFVVKKPLQELDYCFWVTPNWSENECVEYDLKKQILVIVVKEGIEKCTDLLNYLEIKKSQCSDLIFFKENTAQFSKKERDTIKSFIGSGSFRCIFLDQKKISSIEEKGGLREELLHIVSSI